jgi:predicted TIM-barrel fold metal-dependent hydrolase
VRIDLHHHFSPAEHRKRLLRYPVGASVPEWSIDATNAAMQRYGADVAVLSAAAGVYFGDEAEAIEVSRIVNEAAAEIVRSDEKRFGALASLPLPNVGAALDELAYALDTLKLDGVMLHASVAGIYVGEPEFAPLLDELERRRAYVFVHPMFPAWLPSYPYPPWVLELPFETTRAALSLVFSGTLDRCPNIRFQLPHLGGAVPFLSHRMASLTLRDPSIQERLSDTPLAYMRRFYVDTALALNPPAFAGTLALLEPEKIVFGTDWPYLPEDRLDFDASALGIGDAQIAAIERTHAAALVPRLARC